MFCNTHKTSEIFEKIFNLLLEYKFEFIENTDSLTCVVCSKILINACQTVCGCNFCYKCLNECLEKGINVCTAKPIECKMANLKDFFINHSINKQISHLLVKCPLELCTYECRLIDMEEHLRYCSKKYFKCPFYEIGCIHEKVENDKLSDHFQNEMIHHNKIMIDMIIQLKNEVLELKQNELRLKSELNVLKENENFKIKENNIFEIKDKTDQNIKEIIDIYECSLDSNKDIESKHSKTDLENSGQDNNQMAEIRTSNGSVSSQQGINEDSLVIQIEEKFIDMKQTWSRKLDQIINKKIKFNIEGILTKLNELDKRINKKDFIFEWPIKKISHMTKNENITSDFFFNRMNPYKMRLKLRISINFLWIRLRIYSGLSDASRNWPFHADVSIKISNINSPDACRIITQNCKINKPVISSYRSSDRFTFLFSDLSSFGLLNDGTECVVECFVNFD